MISVDEYVRYALFYVEKAVAISESRGASKIVIINDRTGFSKKKNNDSTLKAGIKLLAKTVQKYYPERLKTMCLLKSTWFLRLIFTIISVFLAKETKDKMKFISKNEDLLQFFTKD